MNTQSYVYSFFSSHFNVDHEDCVALGQSCHILPSVLELQELIRCSLQIQRKAGCVQTYLLTKLFRHFFILNHTHESDCLTALLCNTPCVECRDLEKFCILYTLMGRPMLCWNTSVRWWKFTTAFSFNKLSRQDPHRLWSSGCKGGPCAMYTSISNQKKCVFIVDIQYVDIKYD